jgi:hypothetical protein
MVTQRLRLQVSDQDDLLILSTLLQDATVLVGDMAHDPENGQFLMVVARHERDADENRRHLTGINIDGVQNVQRKGFSSHDRDQVLNLLALTTFDDGIEVVFSGAATIRVECPAIKVYAADLGEGWRTVFQPDHKK